MSHPTLARLGRLACVLVAVAATAHAQVPAAADVRRLGDAVVFEGRIDGASAARFRDLLDEGGVRRLVVTSRGGLVKPALDMADAILQHRLDVEVPRTCLSSCANYLFPAGRRKLLGHPRAVGWHGNMAHVLYLHRTGQQSWSQPQMDEARQLARDEAALFRRLGVDGFVCWFGKIAPYDVDEFYALSPEDMARFGIQDVAVGTGQPGPGAPGLLTVDWSRLDADRPAVAPDAP